LTARKIANRTSFEQKNFNISLDRIKPRAYFPLCLCNSAQACSRGGVKFPTGGMERLLQARERLNIQGQQIRCDAGADGIVRMKESK